MRTLTFYAMLLLVPGALVGCGEKEGNDPYYDESFPEKIVTTLIDTPAYVDTVIDLSSGAYTLLCYSEYAEEYFNAIREGRNLPDSIHRKVSGHFIGVSTMVLQKNGIPFRSKVQITASITNRIYYKRILAEKDVDPGWSGYSCLTCPKAYLHRIKPI